MTNPSLIGVWMWKYIIILFLFLFLLFSFLVKRCRRSNQSAKWSMRSSIGYDWPSLNMALSPGHYFMFSTTKDKTLIMLVYQMIHQTFTKSCRRRTMQHWWNWSKKDIETWPIGDVVTDGRQQQDVFRQIWRHFDRSSHQKLHHPSTAKGWLEHRPISNRHYSRR